MNVYLLTTVKNQERIAEAYRDIWGAMDAAADMANATIIWDTPPEVERQEPLRHTGKTPTETYFIDELPVQPPPKGPRLKRMSMTLDAPDAQSVQWFANDLSLGAPDVTSPFTKTWIRPEGQEATVQISVEVVYGEGKPVYRGAVATID